MSKKGTWESLHIVLTTEAVAQLMCVQPSTVRRWRRTGRIPSVKTGKKYLFQRAVIHDMLTGFNAYPKKENEE